MLTLSQREMLTPHKMIRQILEIVTKNLKKVWIGVKTLKTTRKKFVKPANETPIHFLVNSSLVLNHPINKKHLNNSYDAQQNYTSKTILFDGVTAESSLKDHQLISVKSTQNPDIGMPIAGNWKSQRIPLTESYDTIENNLRDLVEEAFRKGTPQLPSRVRSRYI